MKITFFGAGHGVPEPNRRCACAMITVGERQYFIDMGMMAIDELINRHIPVESVRGIFFTHPHSDHMNGLPGFVTLLSWYFTQADPAIYLPDMQAVQVLEDWVAVTGNTSRKLRYFPVQEGLLFDDGFLKITAIPTRHCPHSFAFFAEAEGKSVLFTGDLKKPSVDFPAIALERPTNLIICEAAHFAPSEYKHYLEQCQVERVVINHYNPPCVAGAIQLMKDMRPLPMEFATDGMEVNV